MAGWHEEAGLPNMVFECDWPQKKKAVKPAGKNCRRHPRTIRQENGWLYCTGWL